MQLYDQPRVNNKKTLMPKMQNSQSGEPHQMVEPSLFDIYLCDNCEAELYSYDAYQVSRYFVLEKFTFAKFQRKIQSVIEN